MKHLRKENLPKKVVEELKLDEMTEVFWSENREKYVSADGKLVLGLAFAGVGLVNIRYDAKVEKGDHYLVQDDPYHAVAGEARSVSVNGQHSNLATHYCLGVYKHEEHVKGSGLHRQGIIEDTFPIVYFYPNEFTAFKKD